MPVSMWAEVDQRLGQAEELLQRLQMALRNAHTPLAMPYLAMAAKGQVSRWDQQAFWADVDAFLTTTRSVDSQINSRLGNDAGKKTTPLRVWWDGLPGPEKERRKSFGRDYNSLAATRRFRAHAGTRLRNVPVHRGALPARVKARGLVSGPSLDPLPPSVVPAAGDFVFQIGGRELSLFDTCAQYMVLATDLVVEAKRLDGGVGLTPPPGA